MVRDLSLGSQPRALDRMSSSASCAISGSRPRGTRKTTVDPRLADPSRNYTTKPIVAFSTTGRTRHPRLSSRTPLQRTPALGPPFDCRLEFCYPTVKETRT